MSKLLISKERTLNDRCDRSDLLDQLIAENAELRRTAVDLALETLLLREWLSQRAPTTTHRNRSH